MMASTIHGYIVECSFLICVFLVCLQRADSFGQCHSCTYARLDGDSSIGYECVTDPFSIYVIACEAPLVCVTKVVFNPEVTYVTSATRGCLPYGTVCQGDYCCNRLGGYPTCEHKCQGPMCNNLNAENFKYNLTTTTSTTWSPYPNTVSLPARLFYVSAGCRLFNVYVYGSLAVVCLLVSFRFSIHIDALID